MIYFLPFIIAKIIGAELGIPFEFLISSLNASHAPQQKR